MGEVNASEKQVETEIVKCDACGANMQFHPDTQTLYCEHCGTHKTIENVTGAEEQDILRAFSECDGAENLDNAVLFLCDNCGAKVALVRGETAKCCPFCGTAHVTELDELAGIKPNAVIPFAFGKEKAVEIVTKWAKKRAYAPGKFKKNLKGDNVNGVYTPSFTFDSATSSSYVGRIGKRHTRVVGTGKNKRTQTYTVWRNISGYYNFNFNDILISSGSKISQSQLDKIGPYNTEGSVKYEEEYLLGFMSYRYEEGIEDCWGKAKGVMDRALRKKILSQYSYDVVDYLNVSTTHSNVTYKYVMLPVYVGNFNYGKKLYNYFVNGSTGKIKGKAPVSALKIILTVLAGIALIVGLYFLTQYL